MAWRWIEETGSFLNHSCPALSFPATGESYYVEFITIVCVRRIYATVIQSQYNMVVFHFIPICLYQINYPP